jgi:hypothetical protein
MESRRSKFEVATIVKRLKLREMYFAGLEILRAHIHRTLIQIPKIADLEIPGISAGMRYDENWQLDVYEVRSSEARTKH